MMTNPNPEGALVSPANTADTQNKDVRLFRSSDGKNYIVTFVLMCSLFLLWGFCSSLLDNLNKHFQNTLHISKFKSGFVQNAFYMGYFIMALPAGIIARKFGYKGGIIFGLTLAAAGAFWFVHATAIDTYGAFLLGLFVLASGLACLETIANLYTRCWARLKAGHYALTWRKPAMAWDGFPGC